MYVAGLERGVRPIGDWLISIILSMNSKPLISRYSPGITRDPCNVLDTARYNVSITKDDFPLPETPVTVTNAPRGISTLILFKLLVLAPIITSFWESLAVRLVEGIWMRLCPFKYWAVRLILDLRTFDGRP